MTTVGPIGLWNPGRGTVTTWTASERSREALRRAPADALPPSAQQALHLWGAHRITAAGGQNPRLMVVAWDEEGVCDTTAMTAAINTHLRRHDTYHSAFRIDGDAIERRTVADPRSIEMAPRALGHLTAEQIRDHVLTSTPATLEWDCFTFGVIQRADRFGVYASVDHLHIDMTSAAVIFADIHLSYQALVHGVPNPLPPTAGYRHHVARQVDRTDAMTLESPEIRTWIDVAAEGRWPSFPLPLGRGSQHGRGAWVTAELLDAQQTAAFDAACRAAGARFSGGVMAAAALADHRFTGAATFRALTPSDARDGASHALSVGWFAALFPVTVPIGDGDFAAAARAAQTSFDANRPLAAVPLQRAVELSAATASPVGMPTAPPMMVSYMDFRRVPDACLWEAARLGVFGDELSHGGVNVWVGREQNRTFVTVSFPDTPTARHAVECYLSALRSAFRTAAAGRSGTGEPARAAVR